MVSTPEHSAHDGSDLAKLRTQIDGLKAMSEEERINPLPKVVQDFEGHPTPTDAIGYEDWNNPVPHTPSGD